MIYKYELACKEAGMEESMIAEIRKFFDAELKKLNRDKKARERAGIVFNSLSALVEEYDGLGEYEISDERSNPESIVLNELSVKHLKMRMQELSVDDREFLIEIFSGEYGIEHRYAIRMGISDMAVTRRKKRLIKQQQLRKDFLRNF